MVWFPESYVTGAVVLIPTVVLLMYVYFKRKLSYWKQRGVPYMEPHLLFGNFRDLLFLRRSMACYLADLYNAGKGNKIFGFYIFHKPALLIRDPEVIKQVLIKDFNYFLDRNIGTNKKFDPIGYFNLFSAKGQLWRDLRVKLTPIFTSGKMRNMFPLICECANNLQEYFRKQGKGQSFEIECREIMSKMTTDIISTCAFGLEANSLTNENAELRKHGKFVFTFDKRRAYEILFSFLVPTIANLGLTQVFTQSTSNYLRKVFWDVMNTREKENIKRNDLIDLLIQLKSKGKVDEEGVEMNGKLDNSSSLDFTGDILLAQATIFFTAGFETNASTLTFTQYELALNKDIQTKLREEIQAVLSQHDGKITYAATQDMTYMDMVISETLRKYSPFAVLDRIAMKDYKIPGTLVTIQKGTPIFIAMDGLHHDPEYFPDPEKYDPERFNEVNRGKIVPYTYMPFGEGPHNCIGSRFAQVVIKCTLCHILTQYEIEPCKDTPLTLKFDMKALVLVTEGGIPLRYTPLA